MELRLNLETPTVETGPVAETKETVWGDVSEQISKGDTEAFAIYYERFFGVMFSEAKRLTNMDESSCLDIVQDAMLKVVRSIKRIENEKMLTGWSRAVVKSSAYDWMRKRNRIQYHDEALLRENADDSLEFDETIQQQARIAWIEEQLLEMPEELQRLFSLRYRMGWTLKRISAAIGMKTGAVDGTLRRAIEKLKSKAELENLD